MVPPLTSVFWSLGVVLVNCWTSQHSSVLNADFFNTCSCTYCVSHQGGVRFGKYFIAKDHTKSWRSWGGISDKSDEGKRGESETVFNWHCHCHDHDNHHKSSQSCLSAASEYIIMNTVLWTLPTPWFPSLISFKHTISNTKYTPQISHTPAQIPKKHPKYQRPW